MADRSESVLMIPFSPSLFPRPLQFGLDSLPACLGQYWFARRDILFKIDGLVSIKEGCGQLYYSYGRQGSTYSTPFCFRSVARSR